MVNSYGCAKAPDNFQKYSSNDPELNISLDYISGWLHAEQKGANGSFNQVVFYKPKVDKKDTSKVAMMVVTVEPISKMTLEEKTLQSVTDYLIAKRMKFQSAKVISRSDINIKNFKMSAAVELLLSYRTLDKLYVANSKLIMFKERIVIFQYQDKFYTLRYENKEEEFDKFNKAFSRLIDSLIIK